MSAEEDVYVPSDKGADHMTMESDINSKRSSETEVSKGKRKKASTGSRIDKGFDKVCIVLEKKNKLVEHQMDLEAFEKEKEATYSMDSCYDKLEEIRVLIDENVHMYAIDLFAKPSNRELFAKTKTPEDRARWLRWTFERLH